jgi:hypothetical protein
VVDPALVALCAAWSAPGADQSDPKFDELRNGGESVGRSVEGFCSEFLPDVDDDPVGSGEDDSNVDDDPVPAEDDGDTAVDDDPVLAEDDASSAG